MPPGVRRRYTAFWYCVHCRRVYWKGSHWRNMCRLLEPLLRRAQRASGRTPSR
ncbi:Mut7-C RNAse domain-containing protein [Pseudomonas flexibilis]|uniref:Mut7-C RNAse domain-containing protein n=1 Tax=Pseudomonas flexibilis TaxID=706570 RepID=UPI0009DDBA71|nr:Mut7-C RNAse domain-containing protein [Pseudomonas flexibilis]